MIRAKPEPVKVGRKLQGGFGGKWWGGEEGEVEREGKGHFDFQLKYLNRW